MLRNNINYILFIFYMLINHLSIFFIFDFDRDDRVHVINWMQRNFGFKLFYLFDRKNKRYIFIQINWLEKSSLGQLNGTQGCI
jgi:hypothetical protein